MRLSDLNATQFKIRVIRDGEFTALGSFTRSRSCQLVFLDNRMYLKKLLGATQFSCAIATDELSKEIPSYLGVAVSDSPATSFFAIHSYLFLNTDFYGQSFASVVSDRAKVHPTAFVAMKKVVISDDCEIGPKAVILEGTHLERNVRIGAGCVIGGEGFRYIRAEGGLLHIHHAGGVHIHSGVELHSNVCVDKAIYGDMTEIMNDTKVDNLVHIAHNVRIGRRCMIVACAMIGGSTEIGDDVWIGPNATVSDNLKIGDNAFVSLGAVVVRDVPAGGRVSGNFAIDHSKLVRLFNTYK